MFIAEVGPGEEVVESITRQIADGRWRPPR